MTSSDEAVQHYVDAFRDLAPSDAAPWLKDLRQTGLARFETLGFPSRRNESWKYTDVRPIAKRRFRPSASPSSANTDEVHRAAVEAACFVDPEGGDPEVHRLVFVNGRFSSALSHVTPPAGVRLGSLGQLLAETPDELEPWMTAYSHRELGSFAA